MSWKGPVVGMALGAALCVALRTVDAGSPMWLRVAVGVILLAVTVAPAVPFLALIPWHFVALHRGLVSRGSVPCVVTVSGGVIHVESAGKLRSHALDDIVRARFVRNGNWTESKMLEDALGLFASSGREIDRLPESTTGLDELLVELGVRGIPIEEREVSAPAFLD